jgi:hypothetical protein
MYPVDFHEKIERSDTTNPHSKIQIPKFGLNPIEDNGLL